jgi:hypothetical protein
MQRKSLPPQLGMSSYDKDLMKRKYDAGKYQEGFIREKGHLSGVGAPNLNSNNGRDCK